VFAHKLPELFEVLLVCLGFFVEGFDDAGGGPQAIDRRFVPAGVDDAQAIALECTRKGAEKGQEVVLLLVRVDDQGVELCFAAAIPPAFSRALLLGVVPHGVDLVIAGHALCGARLDEPLDEPKHAGAVGATIDQVANEDEPAVLGMATPIVVAEFAKQADKGVGFTVDVSDDVQRTGRQFSYPACSACCQIVLHSFGFAVRPARY